MSLLNIQLNVFSLHVITGMFSSTYIMVVPIIISSLINDHINNNVQNKDELLATKTRFG